MKRVLIKDPWARVLSWAPGKAIFPGKHLVPLVLSAVLLALPGTLHAETGESRQTLSLDEAIRLSAEHSHLLRAARFSEEKASLQIKRANAEKYLSKAEVNVTTGVVPAARGTAVDSPDTSDSLDSLGPYYKVDFIFAQPLYTFGRLSFLNEAAREGLRVEEARSSLTLEELTFLVIRTYWSLSSTRRARSLAEELRENFQTLLDEVNERLEDEDSEIDDTDLFEVRSSSYQIEKTYFESVEGFSMAMYALRTLTGLNGSTDLLTADEKAPLLDSGSAPFREELRKAVPLRSEVAALEAASRALKAKINLTRSDRYPVIYLGGGGGYADAPNRDDQTNPFVVDDFNYARVGAEIGMRWNANVYRSNLKVEELEKDHLALREKLAALKQKLAVEAMGEYECALKEQALLGAARTSLKAAKSWLRLSLDNWELGLGEVDRLLSAYESFYSLKAVVVEREYEFNIALAKLAIALGDINLYLQWLDEGAVSLKATGTLTVPDMGG